MHLSHMLYEFGVNKSEFMALVIGTKGEKVILIDDKFVSERDAALIRQNIDKISEYNLPNQVKWIRENCKDAYKGYKEIYVSRITTLKVIDIKKL